MTDISSKSRYFELIDVHHKASTTDTMFGDRERLLHIASNDNIDLEMYGSSHGIRRDYLSLRVRRGEFYYNWQRKISYVGAGAFRIVLRHTDEGSVVYKFCDDYYQFEMQYTEYEAFRQNAGMAWCPPASLWHLVYRVTRADLEHVDYVHGFHPDRQELWIPVIAMPYIPSSGQALCEGGEQLLRDIKDDYQIDDITIGSNLRIDKSGYPIVIDAGNASKKFYVPQPELLRP